MTAEDSISVFDQTTLSYAYENGWSFTNFFNGHTRISNVEGRGELHEHIEITQLRPDLYFAAWIDDEMGPLRQIIDLETKTIQAAVPVGNKVELWSGTITAFDG